MTDGTMSQYHIYGLYYKSSISVIAWRLAWYNRVFW